jgi:hypothetical protein
MNVDRLTSDGGDARDWGPTVHPSHLADLLWSMYHTKGPAEATYPEAILNR